MSGTGISPSRPPAAIAPHAVARFWLMDFVSGHGSDATVVHKRSDGQNYMVTFDCPTGPCQNACSNVPQTIFWTKSGDPQGPWGQSGRVAGWGHPFSVKFDVYE